MEIVKSLLSFLSYVYHGLLCLLLLALSGLAMAAGAKSLELGMLPWTGTTILMCVALVGLLTVILAIKGTLRPLFFVWSLAVMLVLIKGYIFSGYHFAPGEFRTAIYLIAGSIIAMIGAWARMGQRSAR